MSMDTVSYCDVLYTEAMHSSCFRLPNGEYRNLVIRGFALAWCCANAGNSNLLGA